MSYLLGVHGQTCNRVMYTDRSICAFKGYSVDISCMCNSYKTSTAKFWFSPERSQELYLGRAEKSYRSCFLCDHSSYIWYKNEQEIQRETSCYSGYFYSANSYSCATKGYEDFFPVPSVCATNTSAVLVPERLKNGS